MCIDAVVDGSVRAMDEPSFKPAQGAVMGMNEMVRENAAPALRGSNGEHGAEGCSAVVGVYHVERAGGQQLFQGGDGGPIEQLSLLNDSVLKPNGFCAGAKNGRIGTSDRNFRAFCPQG